MHNGILENYIELKENLISQGVNFKSDTDTEVGAALLNYLYGKNNNIINTIKEFKKIVKGSYAIAFLLDDLCDRIFVIKNLSPLIIGVDKTAMYIASDIHAILDKTHEYVSLSDGDFGEVYKDKILLYDKDNNIKDFKIKEFSGDITDAQKGEFEHFMLKEIYDEPEVIENIITKYVTDSDHKCLPNLNKYKRVTIVACGSAWHAGLVGKYLIEKNLHIPVDVELASEFKYKQLFLDSNCVVIAISQSGETIDTLAAVKIAKSLNIHTIGIVNVTESSIAREVNEVIYSLAGCEIAVATTKAYLAQTMILYLMANINFIYQNNIENLMRIPEKIKNMGQSLFLWELTIQGRV